MAPGRSTTLLLFAFFCLALLASAAEIEDDNFDGDYELLGGPPNCASTIKIDEADDDIDADELQLNGTECSGDDLKFEENANVSGDDLTSFLDDSDDQDPSWVTAGLRSDLQCGDSLQLARGGRITIFVIDEDDFTVNWTQIYRNASLESLELRPGINDSTVTFKEDTVYLIYSASGSPGRCFYRREGLLDDAVCFPSTAKVTLESGASVSMDQVKVGDRVLVGDGTYSDVYMFTHADADFNSGGYVRLEAEDASRITLTGSHYIYANDLLVAAKDVKVGDLLRKADNSEVRVSKVTLGVHGKGLYNPQTLHGDIVVDGFVASTYTTTVKPSWAHKLLSPLRGWYRFFAGPSKALSNEL